jgi:LmbE family N-acetylglucosaminyl deacetylase
MRALPVAFLLILASALPGVGQQTGAPTPAALEPASSGGLAVVDSALAKLSIHARLLVIGAHPDDEDNSLLTWVARDLGGEAAYLSLSRGEGGQNLIGPELGESLGLVRTGELLAARRIEGTRQYFARAYDFGYTRSLEETFERWPREVLREDALRAARRFKPQVVVAIFPADARAGHGQHQASAVIARDVYDRAGESAEFPGLGLPAWKPSALYRRAWSREDATLAFPLGALEAMGGRSIGQISAASRSSHRSQDMGREQRLGAFRGGLRWIDGGGGEESDSPFAGIDTRLSAIAGTLDDAELRGRVAARLDRVEDAARKARALVTPVSLELSVATFETVLEELRAATEELGTSEVERAVRALLQEKIAVAESGLAAAAGVVIDALAEREAIPFGGSTVIESVLWRTGATPAEVHGVSLRSPRGWLVGATEAVEEDVAPGLLTWRHQVGTPAAAGGAYFLERPRIGDLYDWEGVAEEVRGEPFLPSLLAEFHLRIGSTDVRLEREVVYRFADQAVGEIRRPLRAVPAVEVAVEPAMALWPIGEGREPIEVDVTLTSNLAHEVSGDLQLELPSGWDSLETEPVELEAGGRDVVSYRVRPPGEMEAGVYRLTARLELAGGDAFESSSPVFDYPHIRSATLEVPARTRVQALALRLPSLDRVGYVRGASDRVPELLAKVGVPIEILDLERALHSDLSVFDAIVVGSRAYEIDPQLRRMNGRFLRYVEEGGTLIVQYQQYQFVRGGFAPLSLTIGRPHGRITDETAPVRVLQPAHPVFNRPNPIDEQDWRGWVQERGLYFAEEWDEAFVPLLAMQDPGDQPEQRGGLLVAEFGEGTYVYTGLSFFRELPAGVPGAFRLFANLLALGER